MTLQQKTFFYQPINLFLFFTRNFFSKNFFKKKILVACYIFFEKIFFNFFINSHQHFSVNNFQFENAHTKNNVWIFRKNFKQLKQRSVRKIFYVRFV